MFREIGIANELGVRDAVRILESAPSTPARKIAKKLHLSEGGVRYHINKLKQAGILEQTYWSNQKRKLDNTQLTWQGGTIQ